MAEPPTLKVWTRMHKNGMLAVVQALPSKPNRYAFGALIPGGHASLGEVTGLEEAKKAADHVSACAQPCKCPPWGE